MSFNAKRGIYEIGKTAKPIAFIVAKSAKYFGVLSTFSDQTSNYDFGYVSGQDSSTKDYAYVYGDRPIYRVGDTVHFKGLLRRFNPDGYGVSPMKDVKARILNQEGELLKEFDLKTDKNSNFASSFELPKGMKTGRYDFEISALAKGLSDPIYVYNDGHFFVEQYVKPVFRVTAGETDRNALPKEKVSVPFSAEYYFGGALAMAGYSVSVMTENYFFDPKDYSSYRFGTASSNYDCVYWGFCDHSDQFIENLEGKLDGNGRAVLSYAMPEIGAEDSEKLYNFNIETTDPDTGKTVNQTVTKVLHRTDANVGIRSPYWVNKNDPIRIDGVVLDHDAKPLSGKSVKVEFVRREWKEAKKLGIDGNYYSENEMVETPEKSVDVTTDSEGKYAAEHLSGSGGEFEIRATYVGKNGIPTVSSEYAYVATDAYVAWAGTNNSITQMTAEKTVMKPGEKAVFTLKSPVNSGKVFITVEKDDAILDTFVRDIASHAEKIEIPLDARHIPNVYVKAFLVGKNPNSPLPTYKRALSVVKVLPDEKRLTVTVTADRDRKAPGEPLTVAVFVKDALGNPVANANGSLSVVDESVLALLGNPKKNPFAFFYEMKRYLGVQTYLSLSNLVEKLEVKSADLANGAKGGAGEDRKGGDTKKKRGTFKDTAFWKTDFTTDKNGKFSVTTDNLPDNLTTWVIEAVVSTPVDNRIGVGQASVTTAKEIMVNDNLPRIFRSRDSVTLAPVVFNRTGADAAFDVTVSGTGFSVDKPTKKVSIRNGESKAVEFRIEAKDVPTGADRLMTDVRIEARAGNKSDLVEKFVPIFRSETWETVATVGSTKDASYDERLNLAGIDPARSELIVRYGASLFANATDGLANLLTYPYGCVEQKTSAVLPHVLLKKLSDSLGTDFDIDKRTVPYYDGYGRQEKTVRQAITDYVASLASFKRADGGFGYWPDASRSDFAMTSYVVRTLGEIKAMKIAMEPSLLADASAYLKREFYANKRPYCSISATSPQSCAYPDSVRLDTISAVLSAKSDDYEAYKMWKLLDASKFAPADKVSALSAIARLKKVPTLAKADVDSLNKASVVLMDSVLKNSLVYDSRGAYIASENGESRVRISAAFVEAVVNLGKDSDEISGILDNVTRFLSRAKKSDGSYGSTLDTSATVSAFAARARSDAASITNLVVRANVNGLSALETGIAKADVTKTFEKRLPLAGMPADLTVNFLKTGNGKIYYDLSLTYPVPAERIDARDEGMFVTTMYYDENEYRRVKALKDAEWADYLNGKIRYEALKFPKTVYEYLTEISKYRVGQLVHVRYRVIVADDRDRVAFESFVPSGAEIVNTRLSTETKTVEKDTFFDREEFLDDRYFGYAETLPAGDYEGSYVFRATHAGEYSVPPTKAFEFYTPEVFGRTAGKKSQITAK
ncbi:MAG: alpha-2-macroglobulin [Patescibacteria group bacterium]|nr:alpha-2-macroglobulin [Patescibacteria group bacterium]